MINLVNYARCKTDLVAVGRIAVCGGGNNLALGELSGQRFADLFKRICRAGNAHCAVYISSARKRIAYCAADAGCGSAERLNLCRVVVSLVFEKEQPVLVLSVGVNLDFDCAGVDLLRFVKL